VARCSAQCTFSCSLLRHISMYTLFYYDKWGNYTLSKTPEVGIRRIPAYAYIPPIHPGNQSKIWGGLGKIWGGGLCPPGPSLKPPLVIDTISSKTCLLGRPTPHSRWAVDPSLYSPLSHVSPVRYSLRWNAMRRNKLCRQEAASWMPSAVSFCDNRFIYIFIRFVSAAWYDFRRKSIFQRRVVHNCFHGSCLQLNNLCTNVAFRVSVSSLFRSG